MKCWWHRVILFIVLVGTASAEDMMTDVFSGKLLNPEVGVYAWYNLKDFQSDRTFFLRQAIVAKEKVDGVEGYWLEIQLVPKVGFPTTQKMLLTGPASDPKNIHKIVLQEGREPPHTREVPPSDAAETDEDDAKRESKGIEKIVVPQGSLRAEHFVISRGEDTMDLWVNEAVRPLGIVRMTSQHGELSLSRYGQGGKDGRSVIADQPVGALISGEAVSSPDDVVVVEDTTKKSVEETVEAEELKRPKRNFGGKGKRDKK